MAFIPSDNLPPPLPEGLPPPGGKRQGPKQSSILETFKNKVLSAIDFIRKTAGSTRRVFTKLLPGSDHTGDIRVRRGVIVVPRVRPGQVVDAQPQVVDARAKAKAKYEQLKNDLPSIDRLEVSELDSVATEISPHAEKEFLRALLKNSDNHYKPDNNYRIILNKMMKQSLDKRTMWYESSINPYDRHSRGTVRLNAAVAPGQIITVTIDERSFLKLWVESGGDMAKIQEGLVAYHRLESYLFSQDLSSHDLLRNLIAATQSFVSPVFIYSVSALSDSVSKPKRDEYVSEVIKAKLSVLPADAGNIEEKKNELLARPGPGFFIQKDSLQPWDQYYTVFVKAHDKIVEFQRADYWRDLESEFLAYATPFVERSEDSIISKMSEDFLIKSVTPEFIKENIHLLDHLKRELLYVIGLRHYEHCDNETVLTILSESGTSGANAFIEGVIQKKSGDHFDDGYHLDETIENLRDHPELGFVIQRSNREPSKYRLFLVGDDHEVREISIDRRHYAQTWALHNGNFSEMTAHFKEILAATPDSILYPRMERAAGVAYADASDFSRYAIHVKRQDLIQKPLEELHKLIARFDAESHRRLEVNFAGERGIDAGGPGREYILELATGIVEKMKFKKEDTGLYTPLLNPEDPDAARNCRELGKLFMFCLNSSLDYPIGTIFYDSLFAGILALHKEPLDREFSAIDFSQADTFDRMLEVFAKANPADMQIISNIKKLLPENPTNEQLKAAYDNLDSFAVFDDPEIASRNPPDSLTTESMQFAMRKFIENKYLRPTIAPIYEIARGMKEAPFKQKVAWAELDKMTASQLSQAVQGLFSRDDIINKIEFEGASSKQQQWIKEWIRDATREDMKAFLKAITGSEALGKVPIKLKTNPNDINNNNRDVFYIHSCFNLVDVPWHLITSKESLDTLLKGTIGGGYNRG